MKHQVIDARGTRIHCVEEGSGPLVLLVHGFPESWYSWRHQLPVIAEAGFRAVAHQEEIMHPAIMRRLATDHIRAMHEEAEDERQARQARRAPRRAPSTRLRLPASGTLSYDDPRPGRRSADGHHRAAQRAASAGDGRLAAR